MKAISLWQPWASAMMLGWKQIETRSWSTSYRGPLIIHAAKKIIQWPDIEIQSLFERIAFQPRDLPRGVLLCKVDLVDCKKIFLHNRPKGIERILGNYIPGCYMWITENVEMVPMLQFRGRQRFFNVPDEILKELKEGK